MESFDGCVVPAAPSIVQGYYLITLPFVGLVDTSQLNTITLYFSANNCRSLSASVGCLHSISSSSLLFERIKTLYYGKISHGFESLNYKLDNLQATSATLMLLAAQPYCYSVLKNLFEDQILNLFDSLKRKIIINLPLV